MSWTVEAIEKWTVRPIKKSMETEADAPLATIAAGAEVVDRLSGIDQTRCDEPV